MNHRKALARPVLTKVTYIVILTVGKRRLGTHKATVCLAPIDSAWQDKD